MVGLLILNTNQDFSDQTQASLGYTESCDGVRIISIGWMCQMCDIRNGERCTW